MNDMKIFLQSLCKNLDASGTAYKNYLAGGKTFAHALELKKYNSTITSLLVSNKHLLNQSQQQDAEALLFHYQAWKIKWEQLAASLKPQPDSVFVFENEITFPRAAAGRFEAACHEIS
jgi:hypothetical protein